MPFETYVPQRGPGAGKESIRILKNGDFSISPAAYDKWFDKANYVELMYDAKNKKVGLKPKRNPTKATYKLRESPQGGRRKYVSGQQFCETYGIDVSKAKSFDAQWNDKAGVVEFSVKEAV